MGSSCTLLSLLAPRISLIVQQQNCSKLGGFPEKKKEQNKKVRYKSNLPRLFLIQYFQRKKKRKRKKESGNKLSRVISFAIFTHRSFP